MGRLYAMITIVDRKVGKKYLELYQKNEHHVSFTSLGAGTASSDILDYLGLDAAEKLVVFSVQQEESWFYIKKQLQQKLKIDAPGGGIAFIVPLSSIGGKKALQFLLESRDYQKEEESALKDTVHELIIVIANQGNTWKYRIDYGRCKGSRGLWRYSDSCKGNRYGAGREVSGCVHSG